MDSFSALPGIRDSDDQQRTYMPREKVVSPGMVIAIIASIGITVALALITTYTGSGYVMAATVVTGIMAVSSVAIAIIFGVKKQRANKRHEQLIPGLYEPRPNVSSRDNVEPAQLAHVDNCDEWKQRLENATKNQEEEFPSPAYYNLTSDEPKILHLGDWGNYLQAPHLGQYNAERGVYPDDDHHMAVCLPGTHIPHKIREEIRDAQNVEFYFMVFKDLQEAQGNSRNISMHAMALPNYLLENPTLNNAQLKPGQSRMQENAPGLATNMDIAMFSSVGINEAEGTGALKNRFQTVTISIHATARNDLTPKFSGNHARFEITPNTDVSSMYVVAKMTGRTVVVHALILNNHEGNSGGNNLYTAVQKNSLPEFLDSINESKDLNPVIKNQIINTFTHPEQRTECLRMEQID